MALSPSLATWLHALPAPEIKRLAAFADRGHLNHKAAVAFLIDLGDDGLRALDARYRAAATEPAPVPADVAPPPSEVPPPPSDGPPDLPSPAEPTSPEAAAPIPATEPEGEGGLSPRSPTAGDPRVSPTVPPKSKPETPKNAPERSADAPRLWVVRLRNRKSLEVGRNADFAHLNHKRFSAPLAESFVEFIVREYGPEGIEFEIRPEGVTE